jgi:hypothetical protein
MLTGLVTLWLWLSPVSVWANAVCAVVGAGANSATPSGDRTLSVVTPAGSDLLIALSGIRHTTVTINGAIHAGNAMTAIAASSTLSPVAVRGFYIVNPTAGTNNVVIDYSATPLADVLKIVSCTGVDTANPIHDAHNATGTGTSVANTVANLLSGDTAIDWFVQDLLTTSPTETGTQTLITKGSDGSELGWGTAQKNGTGGVAFGWTTALSEQWASQAFAVKALVSSATRRHEVVVLP